MIGENLVLGERTRLWPLVFIVLAATIAKAETTAVFSLGERSGLSVTELYGASLDVGEVLQISNGRGRTYDVTIARSKISSSGNRSLSGITESSGTFVLVITADGQLQGSLAEGSNFYRIFSEDGAPALQQRDYSALPIPIDEAGVAPAFHPSYLSGQLLELNPTDVRTRSLLKQSKITASAAGTNTVYPVYNPDTVIDVLVYYDSKMSSPEATVDYLFEYSNLAYARTGISLTLNLAGLIPVTINSSQDNTALLDLLENREVPFTQADEDRAALKADLVHLVRIDREGDDLNCGFASFSVYQGIGFRDVSNGITEWNPQVGISRFCYEFTFTHEIGHNLGAAHHRGDYSEPKIAAYDYSFGEGRYAVFNTIMSVYRDAYEETVAVFSDPDSDCLGFPCGVSPEYSDSADNKRTLNNTKFIVAAYEGVGFDYAAVQAIPWYSFCEDETPFRGLLMSNSSQYTIKVMSETYLRPDGSTYFSGAKDEGIFVLQAGENSSWGFCLEEDDQLLGSEITEAFFTYRNPETGEEVEGTHIFFDDDYDGDYGVVRAAAGVGGSVVGNPSIYARVDAEVEIMFQPADGYKLDEVTGTCPGSLHYNVYTAEPLFGDCWAVASFSQAESGQRVQQHFNNLLDVVMFGRGG